MSEYKYRIVESVLFKKTRKLAKKRGLDLKLLHEPIRLLAKGEPLPPNYRDHQLKGRLRHLRECHIQGDWLLVYRIFSDTKTRKALHLTMITTYGVKLGKYSGIVQSEVNMDELI